MRAIYLAALDTARPVLVLTRDIGLNRMQRVTVAPITSRVRGLSTEVLVGARNGLDGPCAVSCENVVTIPRADLGRQVGWFFQEQERELARALVLAYDLAVPLAR